MITAFSFGRFELRLASRELMADGQPTPLGARAFDVLQALIERRERIVTKDELLDIAWPGVVVEENNLQVQISTLRKLLGPQSIATIPGRGYRFTTELDPQASAKPVAHTIQTVGPLASAPRYESSFIGREAEQAELLQLLTTARLVTLTGPGGIGKTRLATSVAELQQACQAVAWVDLAPVGDSEHVPTAVAAALGVTYDEHSEPATAVVTAMRRKSMLVVVDNAEHVIAATADLARAFVCGTDKVKILVTSREPLRVEGEVTYRLEGLSVPSAHVTASDGQQFGAIALFVARAKAADRRFVLDNEAMANVATVCRMLDGMPLAIELAAARVPTLGVKSLCERLQDRFKVLVSHRRDAPKRQQTMYATLDWSYRLLDSREQVVFRRLGVFVGGFTLEAYCDVAGEPKVDEWKTVEVLERLVSKSLVGVAASDVPRYFLLETVRAYAIRKLEEVGDLHVTQQKHAAYFASYFESIYADWLMVTERELTARIRPELDNLRAALATMLISERDLMQGMLLLGASLPVWLDGRQQFGQEGRRYFDFAAQRLRGMAVSDNIRGRINAGVGIFFSYVDIERAQESFAKAIEVFRRSGDAGEEARALIDHARVLARRSDFQEAKRALDDAHAILAELRIPRLDAWHEFCLGSVGTMSGSTDADTHLRSAAKAFDKLGAETVLLFALNEIADNAWACGDLEGAEVHFRQAISRTESQEHVANDVLALPMMNLAGVLIERGEAAQGLTYAKRAMPLLLDAGRSAPAYPHIALGLLKIGKITEAAILQGFAMAAYAEGKYGNAEPNEKRSLDTVDVLLKGALDHDERERLLSEGTRLNGDDALDLMFQALEDMAEPGTTMSGAV